MESIESKQSLRSHNHTEYVVQGHMPRFPGAQRMNRGSYVVKDGGFSASSLPLLGGALPKDLMELARSHEMTDVGPTVGDQ